MFVRMAALAQVWKVYPHFSAVPVIGITIMDYFVNIHHHIVSNNCLTGVSDRTVIQCVV